MRVGFAVPTPFESRPIGAELALCQRYLAYFSGTNDTFPGMILSGSTSALILVNFSVQLRAAPASAGFKYSAVGDMAIRLPSGSSTSATSVSFDGATRYAASFIPAGLSGATAGNATLMRINNAGYVYFDVEL